ncbi:LysR family transcriptional regulator [Schauerella aestuarii]|uniref:LysR family transcriptional regulator n=1 Tax=Schauerella aestuarii TaxID=2511204 RepID=UPI00136AB668|nr:LysR family transcriptional regulator [Achromobacter aestuarii]MYZ45551.1 LysR family transcriptional regulator [Achromobacter aestuarii]
MNLTPRQLKIFVVLAETLSFQKTADKLHMTQPTLSKLLKEIETTIGMKLFERSTRMVRLSQEGQDILEVARQITLRYDQGMLELNERMRDRHNRVAVAALPTLAASLLPQLIKNLKIADPQAHIDVYDPIANEALQLLRERRVDIAVTAMGNDGSPDLHYQELFTEPFVLFHSHRTRIDVTRWIPAELARLPLISMAPGTSVRVLTERAFQSASQPFDPVYSLRDLNTIARFVQNDCGIALLPESSLDQTVHHGVAKTYLQGALTRSVGMFIRREYRASKLAQQTLDELRRLGRDRQS